MRFGQRHWCAIALLGGLAASTAARADLFHTIPRETLAMDYRTGDVMMAPAIPYGEYAKDYTGAVHGALGHVKGVGTGLHGKLGSLLHGKGGNGACGACGGKGFGCGACGGTGLGLGRLGHGSQHFGQGGGACADGCGGGTLGGNHAGLGHGLGSPCGKHKRFGCNTCPPSVQSMAPNRIVLPSGQSLDPGSVACGGCEGRGCGKCGGLGLFRKHRNGGLCRDAGCGSCGGQAGCGSCGGRGCGKCGLIKGLGGLCRDCGGRGCGKCGLSNGLGGLCRGCGGRGCGLCQKAKGLAHGLINKICHKGDIKYFVGAGGPVPITPGYVDYVNPIRSPRDFFAFPPFADVD